MFKKSTSHSQENIFKNAEQILGNNFEYHARRLLPDGKVKGSEYFALNPTRNDQNIGSFSVNIRTGLWCDHANGDSGNFIQLIAYVNNISDIEAAQLVIQEVGRCYNLPASAAKIAKPAKVTKNKEDLIKKIWNESQPAKGTLVETYLKSRGINLSEIPSVIKYHPDLYYDKEHSYPAMVTGIKKYPSDEIIAIHRTYLKNDGSGKADVESNKKILGSAQGGSIQLFKPDSSRKLIIAEGVENALSVYLMTGIPAWSAISASFMPNIEVPGLDIVDEIIIATDNDKAGIKAANYLAAKLLDKDYKFSIAYPEEMGMDFNDLLLGGKNE